MTPGITKRRASSFASVIGLSFLVLIVQATLGAPNADAVIYVSPLSVDFFSVPVGSYGGTRTVQIINSGPEDVRSMTVSDSCLSGISVQAYGCFGQLPAHQSCSLNVTFYPNHEGYHSCFIRINTELSSSTISVSGSATKR